MERDLRLPVFISINYSHIKHIMLEYGVVVCGREVPKQTLESYWAYPGYSEPSNLCKNCLEGAKKLNFYEVILKCSKQTTL